MAIRDSALPFAAHLYALCTFFSRASVQRFCGRGFGDAMWTRESTSLVRFRLRAAMICRQAKVEGKACSRAAAARACSVWTVFMMFHHGSAHVESLIAWASAVVRNTALACRNLHSSHRQQQQQWHLGGKSQSQSAAVMVCFSLRICTLRDHVPCWAFGEFSWRLRAIGRQRGGLAA